MQEIGLPIEIVVKPLQAIRLDPRTSNWCQLPYPNHPKGCPNFNKKPTCPPKAKWIEELIEPPYFLVGVKFNLKTHIERMRAKHPKWSEKQLKCLLYWQPHINKKLKQTAERLASQIPNSTILYTPEANGVHVFNTCKTIKIILERNPQTYIWKIAILGTKKCSIMNNTTQETGLPKSYCHMSYSNFQRIAVSKFPVETEGGQ